ncbi:MAG: hypothetical protein AB1696_15945 [Planctomycetota bacterium]
MASASPNDTYAIRLRNGQWLLIRPFSCNGAEGKKDEEKARKAKVLWLDRE